MTNVLNKKQTIFFSLLLIVILIICFIYQQIALINESYKQGISDRAFFLERVTTLDKEEFKNKLIVDAIYSVLSVHDINDFDAQQRKHFCLLTEKKLKEILITEARDAEYMSKEKKEKFYKSFKRLKIKCEE